MKTMQKLYIPPLEGGKVYVEAIRNKNGDSYHLILLPGDNGPASWKGQMDWAESIGGDLPTRAEQLILFANFRDQFTEEAYWSNEVDADYSGWAWSQYFKYGTQSSLPGTAEFRARAVSRLPVQSIVQSKDILSII